jgi:hypothetical protein
MDASPPHRHHPLRWVLVGVSVLVLGAAAGVGLLFTLRDRPDEQSVDDAVEEFRGDEGTAQVPGSDRPEAGVYSAEGDGSSALGLLGLTQSDGPSIPITVVHEDDGCWSLEMALNEAHRQVNRLCRLEDGSIVEPTSETEQEWDLGATTQDNHTTFSCDEPATVDDPDAEPGDRWPLRCTGTNSGVPGETISEGPTTFVGEEVLEVDGDLVTTRHLRQQRTITGSQEGDQVIDHWYAADTGLLVREERRSEVASDSPVGSISYAEEGWWQLTSLSPRT